MEALTDRDAPFGKGPIELRARRGKLTDLVDVANLHTCDIVALAGIGASPHVKTWQSGSICLPDFFERTF